MGPARRSSELRWFEPRGFLRDSLSALELGDGIAGPALLVALPALALTLAVFFTTRSAVARFLATSATVAVICVAGYGLLASGVWRFFHWRWSASIALFAVVAGGALTAPVLARSLRERGWPLRVLLYTPVFVLLVAFERNATGTDPNLPFAVSPWPVVQVMGLETFATGIAFALLGASQGLWSFANLRESAGRGGALAVGVVVAAAFPALCIGIGAGQGLLPFQMGPGVLWVVGGLSVAILATCSVRQLGRPARLAERGRLLQWGAILLGVPLILGQTLTRLDYNQTREVRAQSVIDGLARYYETEREYPNELEGLVDAGVLDEVPRPRIGFLGAQEFAYQNFGTNYLLEFSAPRWIQCAYNPPWEEELLDEEDLEEAESLGGAWSCPKKPPELW